SGGARWSHPGERQPGTFVRVSPEGSPQPVNSLLNSLFFDQLLASGCYLLETQTLSRKIANSLQIPCSKPEFANFGQKSRILGAAAKNSLQNSLFLIDKPGKWPE